MAHIQRLICLLLLVFANLGAHAAITPSVHYFIDVQIPSGNGPELGPFASPPDACGPWYSASSAANGWAGNNSRKDMGHHPSPAPNGRCTAGNGTAIYTSRPVKERISCPPGYAQQGDVCISEIPPTADEVCESEGLAWNGWKTVEDRTGVVRSMTDLPMDKPFKVCMPLEGGGASGKPPGCMHMFTPNMRYRMAETDPWIYEGDSWAIGAGTAGLACVPGLDEQPGDPPIPTRHDQGKCKGIPGQVNGVDVCIDPSSAYTEGVDWTQVTDAEGNTREIKTEVKCEGEKCTVTTTNKLPGSSDPGNVTTTTTTRGQYCAKNPESAVCKGGKDESGSTRNQNGRGGDGDPAGGGGGKGDGEGKGFCEENPNSPQCKESSFGGSCQANFTCDGDAIQCSIAREQHIRNCKLFDDPSDESRLYDAERAKDPNRNVTDGLPGNESLAFGSDRFDSTALLGAGSCVSDLSIDVLGKTVSLPVSQVCPYVAWLRTILLALGALLWMVIVFKG